jgi:hypothetical protein
MSIESIVASGRRLIATTFLDTGVVSDRVLVKDTKGGTKQTWTPRAGDPVDCRFVALDDDAAKIVGDTAFGVPTAMWLAPVDTEVKQGDKVVNGVDGSVWIFTSNMTPPSELKICVRMGIREVES